LAEAIRTPVSYVSQVLGGSSHFSMKQAEGVNEFFEYTEEEEEEDFFLLLVQLSRAGTPLLKKRLEKQRRQILSKRLILKERLGVQAGISKEDENKFYSSWIYGAIHVMLSAER